MAEIEWEADLGWHANDAVDTLARSLEQRGYTVSRMPVHGLHAFDGPDDALQVVLQSLPDRDLSGLVQLKRCRMRAGATGTPTQIEAYQSAVRMALLRGGG